MPYTGILALKYVDAKRVVVFEQSVSLSLIQSVVQVNYEEAKLLLGRMESEGVISSPDGNGTRRVLLKP